MRRRDVLASAAGSLSLAAGCLSGSAASEMRTLSTAAPEESIDCDGDPHPITVGDGESYPEQANGFKLEASTETVAIGDEITFTLTNVGGETREIGEKYKYNILRRDGDWKPVFYMPQIAPWTDLAVEVRPGGGFRWPFTVDREGLERENGSNPAYYVCSPVEPGEYRFVFFGVDDTVATTFTVEDG